MTKANVGTVLCGRYRIQGALGAGGMASVWRGEQISTGLPAAIKVLRRELLDTPGADVRFQSEARAVAQLRSKNVVRLIDYDVDPEAGPFIVMELLEGETLGERLARGDRIPPPELARIFAQIARGLDHAHAQGIVHRDLKPDNVFLARDEDGTSVVKLVDFGVAKVPFGRQSGLTSPGLLVGTASYMSPEQALGKESEKRSDLWALGVIAYECVVGQVPFGGDTLGVCLLAICTLPTPVPSTVNPAVSPLFDAWFARACARDPESRFESAGQLAAELERVCASIPASGRPRDSRPASAPPPSAPAPGDARGDADACYYVTTGETTVGPVTSKLLLQGMDPDRVPESALVWRKGWPHWRQAALVRAWLAEGALLSSEPAPPSVLRDKPGLEAIGPRSMLPPAAPAVDSDPAETGPDTPIFHIDDGKITVGPVSGTVLVRGVGLQLVPHDAYIWREGWEDWRPVADVVWELAGLKMPPPVEEQEPGSLRALGRPSMMPPGAPDAPSSR
jgi:serine/threonine-protein kinase